jgi:cytochrome c-type biogenesis protein CcmH
MTARYGDFVLYRPPLKSTTALLWFGPAAMLLLGGTVLLLVLRRRTKLAANAFEPDADDDEVGERSDPAAPASAPAVDPATATARP